MIKFITIILVLLVIFTGCAGKFLPEKSAVESSKMSVNTTELNDDLMEIDPRELFLISAYDTSVSDEAPPPSPVGYVTLFRHSATNAIDGIDVKVTANVPFLQPDDAKFINGAAEILKNGDTITFTLDYDKEAVKSQGFKLTSDEFDITYKAAEFLTADTIFGDDIAAFDKAVIEKANALQGGENAANLEIVARKIAVLNDAESTRVKQYEDARYGVLKRNYSAAAYTIKATYDKKVPYHNGNVLFSNYIFKPIRKPDGTLGVVEYTYSAVNYREPGDSWVTDSTLRSFENLEEAAGAVKQDFDTFVFNNRMTEIRTGEKETYDYTVTELKGAGENGS